jgi:hypothetical protein
VIWDGSDERVVVVDRAEIEVSESSVLAYAFPEVLAIDETRVSK